MPTLKLPTPLRPYANGQVEITVTGRTVREAMRDLIRQFPVLQPHLYNGDENLRPFVNLFVGDHSINDLQGVETPLAEDARLMLIPSIAGGNCGRLEYRVRNPTMRVEEAVCFRA